MNHLQKPLITCLRQRSILGLNLLFQSRTNASNNAVNNQTDPQNPPLLQNEEFKVKKPLLNRTLNFLPKYVKPREIWVENLDSIKEEKRGLVKLHPDVFSTIPRLDLVFENIRWQQLYSKVIVYSAKNRIELPGGRRKPHPQKGTGKARQGSIRAPHMRGGGSCHGPRNPTSYYYSLENHVRVHGLRSTLSTKFAQDDLHVVDDINIPTQDGQYILDLIKERNWGPSVLIVDADDIMPKNITLATDAIGHVNLMPVYGLNVYGMLKHDTLVLTLAAVNEIEDKIINLLHTANPFECRNNC